MWWKDGVLYQIYPRSFSDSNGDGIGDLRGIIEKLDYLNDGTGRSLGIDGIWFSPFFCSPMCDFGYDVSDYRNIDPIFGSLEDFKLLLAEAHRRGIHIIIDLVLNHTSDRHPWFQESRLSGEGPKANWYIWHPGKKGRPPNNWFSQFELKNAWWYEPSRGEFYLATFTRHQPEVNWRDPALKREMFDIVAYWLDMGVDGLRFDAINWFIKDDRLRSNPFCLGSMDFHRHVYDRNRPETIDICREMRRLTDCYRERMMVGEVFANDPGIVSTYYGNGTDALHLVFYLDFLFQPWDARRMYESLADWYHLLPQGAWPTFTLSNHDNLRHILRYGKGKWTQARARVAAALLLTLRGTPFLYYGEEIGMTGGRLTRKDLVDPVSRKTWPFRRYRRDLARTPMQWDDSANAGFSAGKPWLSVDKRGNNVDAQEKSDDSLLSFYRKLIWLRKGNEPLQSGSIEFQTRYLPKALVYVRESKAQKVLVILNFTARRLFMIPSKMRGKMEVLLGSARPAAVRIDFDEGIDVNPYEVVIAGEGGNGDEK
jgi:alpha-glucosidase